MEWISKGLSNYCGAVFFSWNRSWNIRYTSFDRWKLLEKRRAVLWHAQTVFSFHWPSELNQNEHAFNLHQKLVWWPLSWKLSVLHFIWNLQCMSMHNLAVFLSDSPRGISILSSNLPFCDPQFSDIYNKSPVQLKLPETKNQYLHRYERNSNRSCLFPA